MRSTRNDRQNVTLRVHVYTGYWGTCIYRLYPYSGIVAIQTQRQGSTSCEQFSSCGTVAVSVDGIEGFWKATEKTPISFVSSLRTDKMEGVHTYMYSGTPLIRTP